MAPHTMKNGFSAAAAALVAALLVGCSSGAPHREAAPSGGRQGGSWDLVLAGPRVASAAEGPENRRRDDALQWTAPESTLTRTLASPYGPPDLVRARRLMMPRDPYGYIYYLDLYGGPRR